MAYAVDHDPENGLYRLSGGDADSCSKANAFLRTLAIRGLSAQTVRAYAFDLVSVLCWLTASQTTLEQLDQAQLVEFIASQQRVGAQPTSINRRLTTVGLLYRFVTGQNLPPGPRVNTPAPYYKGRGRDRELGLHAVPKAQRRLLRVKVPQKVVEPLQPKQVFCFFDTLRRYRDLAIVSLMLFCGLRSREVLALRRTDLNFDEQRVRIIGKGQRERFIPLPEMLHAVLRDYFRLERPREVAGDTLFVVLQGPRRGRAMTPVGLRSLFRHRRSRHADICNANAHRWRHTFGRDMAQMGVRLPLLQRLMGHADAKTTLRYINLSMADVAAEYHRAMVTIKQRYARES